MRAGRTRDFGAGRGIVGTCDEPPQRLGTTSRTAQQCKISSCLLESVNKSCRAALPHVCRIYICISNDRTLSGSALTFVHRCVQCRCTRRSAAIQQIWDRAEPYTWTIPCKPHRLLSSCCSKRLSTRAVAYQVARAVWRFRTDRPSNGALLEQQGGEEDIRAQCRIYKGLYVRVAMISG